MFTLDCFCLDVELLFSPFSLFPSLSLPHPFWCLGEWRLFFFFFCMFLFLAAFLLSDTLLTPVFWGRGTSALTDTGPCLEGGLGTLLMKLGAVEETNAAAPCPSAGAGSHHLGFKVGEVFNHSESPPSPICLRTVCTHPTPSFSIKSPLKPPLCAFFFF